MENDASTRDRSVQNRVHKPNRKTHAAKWNLGVLAALQRELEMHPEKDMTTILGASYSSKLESIKQAPVTGRPRRRWAMGDVRSRITADDVASYIHGPSPHLQSLLPADGNLSESIVDLLEEANVLYEGVWAASRMVFQLSDTLVVKFAEEEAAVDEYRTLVFLRDNIPDFPAPRPHGVVFFGCYGLLFSDYVSGCDLAREWPQMSHEQKQGISSQLDAIFVKLRSLPRPPDTPLGALQGGGCKDGRRAVLTSTAPIMTPEDFEAWVFSTSKIAKPAYVNFIRGLLPRTPPECVFTHGDLRLENIVVDRVDGGWEIRAVVDWETSGFYPDYWESVKMTNNMNSTSTSDWYNYLPASISPAQYPGRWLVDKLWDFCI